MRREGFVAHANVPLAVDHDRRQGFLLLQDEIEGVAHVLEVDGGPSLVAERRNKSRRQVKFVLRLQRQIERRAQDLDHVPAGLRASVFQEAQMAAAARLAGEVELAEAAGETPVPEQASRNPGRARRVRPGLWLA